MAEVSQLSRAPFVHKVNVKLLLKWTTFTLLVLIILELIWSLIDELQDIHRFKKDNDKEKDAMEEMRGYQVSVWSNHVLYLAYILLAIYATVKEKYPLLLSFSIVDLILDFISIFDFEGVLFILLELSVTLICFTTAIYFKIHQNIPWNPL